VSRSYQPSVTELVRQSQALVVRDSISRPQMKRLRTRIPGWAPAVVASPLATTAPGAKRLITCCSSPASTAGPFRKAHSNRIPPCS
jgi:hypothetical protein